VASEESVAPSPAGASRRQDIGDNAEECANEAPGSSRALHFNLLALFNPLALSTLCIRRDNIAKKT
jgi:hypothetical protein